jgi:hypothetical protein
MIYVETLEEVLERCGKYGIEIDVRPRHYYWGTLELVIKDPDGLALVFITPYSDVAALALGADETFGTKPD